MWPWSKAPILHRGALVRVPSVVGSNRASLLQSVWPSAVGSRKFIELCGEQQEVWDVSLAHMRACKRIQLPAARTPTLVPCLLNSTSSHGYVATHAPIHQVAPDKERESASTGTAQRVSCGFMLCALLHSQARNSGVVGASGGRRLYHHP